MDGKAIVYELMKRPITNRNCVAEFDVGILAKAIDAALAARDAQARAEEREAALVPMLALYDAWQRSGWEDGPTLTEAINSIHNYLCNCDCDPNDPRSAVAAAIRARRP